MTSTELTKGVIELKVQQSRVIGYGIIKTPRYVDNEAKVIPAKVIMGLWLGFILLLGPSLSYAQIMYGGGSGGSGSGVRPYSQTFTESGTFNVPTGVKTIFLTGCGAGGGGGGGHTADPGGGGGGGAGGSTIFGDGAVGGSNDVGTTCSVGYGGGGGGGAATFAGGDGCPGILTIEWWN